MGTRNGESKAGTQVREEPLERASNAFSIFDELPQDNKDGCSTTPTDTLAERHSRGNVSLHLHLRCHWPSNDLGDYCVVFYRCLGMGSDLNRGFRTGRLEVKGDVAAFRDNGDHGKQPVFVRNVKCFYAPQRGARRVRSVIRLYLLDECLSSMWKSLNSPLRALPVLSAIQIDRKHGDSVVGIGARQLPRDVVKGGTQTVD